MVSFVLAQAFFWTVAAPRTNVTTVSFWVYYRPKWIVLVLMGREQIISITCATQQKKLDRAALALLPPFEYSELAFSLELVSHGVF